VLQNANFDLDIYIINFPDDQVRNWCQ